MRKVVYKSIENPEEFKYKLLYWAKNEREIIFLDSNKHNQTYGNYNCVLAIDALTAIKTDFDNAFDDLQQYQQLTKDWLFGYLSYDLKNDIEDLTSNNFDGLQFPDLYFFQPKKLFLIKDNQIEIQYLNLCDDEIEIDFEAINKFEHNDFEDDELLEIKQRISKVAYVEKVNFLKEQIKKGNLYEANLCMEFFTENVDINPFQKFEQLNQISKAPFSVFFKNHKHFLLSASPERYLKKMGTKLISQPIKGTAARFENPVLDEKSKNDLMNNPKEKSENIMITDLVRNDLSQTAQKGSVCVEHLCEIHSFNQVHQMITTISSQLENTFTAIDVIKKSFPMGSMTGAPKISAMKIIEQLEETKRGLYSGAVGYFTPNGDFDFNVVIRSILYNQENNYLSYSVGSAITARSEAEQEYQECLLKAKAMKEILSL